MTDSTRHVSIVLFDFTDPENPKRMEAQMAYEADAPFMPGMPPLKVSVHVGDDCASGSVTLPLAILNALMATLMQGYQQEKQKTLVGFDKPGIILPN